MQTPLSQLKEPEVIYEDNHVLGLLKPPQWLSQPDGSVRPDILEWARNWLKAKYAKKGNVYVGLVHRLDREVSGVMLLAKTSKAAGRLSDQVRTRQLGKTYLAWVEGSLRESGGTAVHFLGGDAQPRVKIALSEAGDLKRAELHFKVLNRLPHATLVEIDLVTGRKHQIRAQFSEMGHPVVGDSRYGARPTPREGISLTASRLEWIHPTLKTPVVFSLGEERLKEFFLWSS